MDAKVNALNLEIQIPVLIKVNMVSLQRRLRLDNGDDQTRRWW